MTHNRISKRVFKSLETITIFANKLNEAAFKLIMKKLLLLILLFFAYGIPALAQQSVARQWNEVMLSAIREDLARPPVQARNLFHVSVAMYDAWAAYDATASTYLLGKTIGGTYYPYTGITLPAAALIPWSALAWNSLSAKIVAISWSRLLTNLTPAAAKILSTAAYRFV